jgi:methionyl-tRNA synthetase
MACRCPCHWQGHCSVNLLKTRLANPSFHCIFWPAFLLAAGLKPPRQILVHGHWTLNGLKMSKSLGNVISPSEVLSSFHPDVIRYYMIKEGGQEGDGNWNSDSLQNRYTFLCNTWGNLLSRTMSSKLAGFLAMSKDFNDEDLKEMPKPQVEEERQLLNAIESALAVYRYNMSQLNLEAALSVLDNLFRTVNSYQEL